MFTFLSDKRNAPKHVLADDGWYGRPKHVVVLNKPNRQDLRIFISFYDQQMHNYFTDYHTPSPCLLQIVYTATTQTDITRIVAT